jgi:uncharacterized protein YpmB
MEKKEKAGEIFACILVILWVVYIAYSIYHGITETPAQRASESAEYDASCHDYWC